MMRGSVVVGMVAVMVLMVAGQHSVVAYPRCDGISCPEIYQPVCGSDGKTYDNNCYFSIAKCKDRRLRKLHEGECGQQQDDCPGICTFEYAPVCGSDGKTYGNRCQLEAEKRCNNPKLTLVSDGECPPPLHGDCPGICTADYRPVCGSDGKTYGNLCALQAEKRCVNPKLTLVSDGECPRDCPGICTLEYAPVCGSDGKTYGNRCQLEAEKRCNNPQLTVVSIGECPKQQPDCPRACPAIFAPVCGSDGKTYSNSCSLGVEVTCNNRPDLYIVSDGPCKHLIKH